MKINIYCWFYCQDVAIYSKEDTTRLWMSYTLWAVLETAGVTQYKFNLSVVSKICANWKRLANEGETSWSVSVASLYGTEIIKTSKHSDSLWFWLFFCLFSGRAIKHVKESIFTPEAGARRGVPKVLVVLTDGRSQDDVNKVSKEMQMEGVYFTLPKTQK